VPQSGTPAAIGYAEESGIPYGEGLVKNSYVGRTFIQPSQTIRQLGIRLKLNPLREAIKGKRLVVVDDSIVRGNTQRALVRMLREAGALEVHVRISSPPVRWPCFYGIDFANRAELIAGGLGVAEITASIGADSLAYVSLEGLVTASHQPSERLCHACFTGSYPLHTPDLLDADAPTLPGVGRQETLGSSDPSPDDSLERLLPGVGAAEALSRP
jgi:amidophosphoribosyltransferase